MTAPQITINAIVGLQESISNSMPCLVDIVRSRRDVVKVVGPLEFQRASVGLLRVIEAFRGNGNDTNRLKKEKEALKTLKKDSKIELSTDSVVQSGNPIWERLENPVNQGSVNDLAEKCWSTAAYVGSLEDYADQAVTNRSGKTYVLGKSFFYKVQEYLLDIAVAYRGMAKDLQAIGIVKAKHSDYEREPFRKIQLANEAIHELEETIKLNYDYRGTQHYLGLAYYVKGKNSGWGEREVDYMASLDHLKEAQNRSREKDTQELIVDIQSEFAEETIDPRAQADWYREAIESAKKLVGMKMCGNASNYNKLGMLQLDFSKQPCCELDREVLKREGIRNLKISYGLEKDEDVLAEIQESESPSW